MKIMKRFTEDTFWNETTKEECLTHTEADGYWKRGTVLEMLADGHTVSTPFAAYKVEPIIVFKRIERDYEATK